MGIPEGGEREKGAEGIFEVIMAKNFPKLTTYTTKLQIQEAQRTPSRIITQKIYT